MQQHNTTLVVFANQLSALMQERRVTQVHLAKEFQLSQAAVSKWLKGSVPSGVTLVRLARFFGVTAEEMVGLEPSAKKAGKPPQDSLSPQNVKDSVKVQSTSEQDTEVSALLDQLKARIKSDLAKCQAEESRARLRLLVNLFGLGDLGPRKKKK